MVQRNDLNANPGQEMARRMAAQESNRPLGNSDVSRGNTIFRGNESLKVIGSQLVSGWLIITGTLKVVGSFLLEGATTMTGNLVSSGTALFTGAFTSRGTTRFEGDTTQQGALHVVGNQDNTGTLAIKGVTTLQSDLNVTTGGRIIAGSTIFNPTGVLSSSGTLSILGSSGISLSGSTTIGGTCTLASVGTTSSPANMFLTAGGVVQKVTSARRFKIDPLPAEVPDALADVPVKVWIDLGNAERFAELYNAPRPFTQNEQADYDGINLTRVPGVIAEEVEAAGGEQFVIYGPDGVIEGVAYDRLALARTQVLVTRLESALDRISDLEARLAS